MYQLGSYRYWEQHLGREPLKLLEPGSFGENFTVDGLPDDEVCIGDRRACSSPTTAPASTCG